LRLITSLIAVCSSLTTYQDAASINRKAAPSQLITKQSVQSNYFMSTKQYTVKPNILSSWIHQIPQFSLAKLAPLAPVRNWLNNLEISDRNLARKLCHTIPTQCPFEKEISLLGRTILRIPPLCKLNPLYNEVVALRFRAICYLADECGEDVSAYC
jgi:hypothetical protein